MNDTAISSRLPRGLIALRHRNFRYFWLGQLISLMGTWMQNTAQSWLVLHLTNSPFLVGLVGCMQWVPLLLFTLLAGVAADRVPKKKLLYLTQASMLLLALTLGILTLTGTVRYWHILILAFGLGTANAFDMPTRQSFIVEMVGHSDLTNAIVLNSAAFNAARVVGPALAGIAMGRLGIGPCFILNAASFVAVLFGLLLVSVQGEPKGGAKSPVKEQIIEGAHYISQTPVVLGALVMMGLLSCLAMNFNVLIPVLAKMTLHQGAEGFGYLMSAMGFGALIGSVILAIRSHRGPSRSILLAGGFALCGFQLLLAASHIYLLSLLLLALTGLAMIIFTASTNTTVQMNVPNEMRGRVMSFYSLVFLGTGPLGNLLAGAVAHLGGAPLGIALGAITGLISMIAVLVWEQKKRRNTKNQAGPKTV
jgi:MFS family permease